MLVLTREVGEKIAIGDEIYLCVLSVAGNAVSLGVEAPRHITVHREEIHLRILAGLAEAQASEAG